MSAKGQEIVERALRDSRAWDRKLRRGAPRVATRGSVIVQKRRPRDDSDARWAWSKCSGDCCTQPGEKHSESVFVCPADCRCHKE